MVEDLRVTVLAENTARRPGLLAEHGLAFWIEADGHPILFDTGQGNVLRHNADRLRIPLETAQTVVLSHGHFDHTGGLKDVLNLPGQKSVYVHPAALEDKFAREKSPPHRDIGISDPDREALHRPAHRLTWTSAPAEVAVGVHVTGEIPRRNDFEDTGGPFYRDGECTDPDPLVDDQALYVETPAGLMIVLGCAHAGVVNTMDYVARLTGQATFYAVIGGMHLVRATGERLEATAAALKRCGVRKIGLAHCTGMAATAYLWSRLPGKCFECPVGSTFVVGGEAVAS